MRPGDRVVTYEQQASATEVDPETWRKITLRLPNPDCPEDVVDLQLLRSPEWMESVGCAEGAQIWFDLDEMAIHGPALVTAVEACPPLAPGIGRVVLATVTHFNTCVLDVRLVGQAETLSPTSNHPLYSATRHDWVRAGSLTAGEQLVTREGTVSVEAVSALPGTHRVYNIEVEVDHCYFTGSAQVLSHNACPPSTTARAPLLLDAPKTARLSRDIAVNPTAPQPRSLARAIGGNPAQQRALAADIQDAFGKNATDIRVNQQQVNALNERVGVNRPDLQYTLPDGKRVYIEYDNMTSSTWPNSPRGAGHADRILANDPNGVVILRTF